MPWAIAFMGYAAGAFPPCRTSFSDFLKAAHTLALAQAEAHRAVKAASPKATVGSAYEMAPAYPKTDSDDDRAAAARYHAMNNVFFLEAARHGHYPKAFAGETPYELMGFKAGDEKLLYAQLNWVGFHYYTRRIVSDASKGQFLCGGKFSGTEIENNSPGGRDPTHALAPRCPHRAFHAWTLLDNFQWAEGYTERYGLIYTDFRNQKRTIKDSGLWYGRVAVSNRLNV
jgi:beta-glucosidase